MRFRSAGTAGPVALVSVMLLQWFAAVDYAEAQRQKFKLGGGAGFAFMSDPEINLGSTATVGGFFGVRFTDNVSVEAGFAWMRSNRVFAESGIPVDDTPDTPSFRFESNRYHLDGTFVWNVGRRQPFHPFLLAGGGVRRRDEKRTEFTFEPDPDTGVPILISQDVVLDGSTYEFMGHVGLGAEIYFMYNLAARAEWRLWAPQDWDRKDHMFFFAASFYF